MAVALRQVHKASRAFRDHREEQDAQLVMTVSIIIMVECLLSMEVVTVKVVGRVVALFVFQVNITIKVIWVMA